MIRLIKYLLHIKTADRLPRIPRHYANEYEHGELSETEARLMQLSAIRSPRSIRALERRKRASADELAKSLPIHHKPRRRSILPILRTITGALPYDPMRSIAMKYRKRRR